MPTRKDVVMERRGQCGGTGITGYRCKKTTGHAGRCAGRIRSKKAKASGGGKP